MTRHATAPTGPVVALVPLLGTLLAALALWNLARALPGGGLLDFGSFHASGAAARDGLDPYGIYPLTFHVVLPGFESWNPNLNPPAALPLFDLLSRIEPHLAFRLWWSVSFGAYALVVALLARRYLPQHWVVPVLWAAALAGFSDTLVLGQIYTPLVLAAVIGWLWLERRPTLAGLAIGVVAAVKPNFLVWPALLFLAGHRRPALSALISFAILSALPAGLYGPTVYRQWAAVIAGDAGRAVFLTNASLAGLLQRLGLGREAAALLGLATLLPLALVAWRRKPDVHATSALGLVGGIVASPLAWVHYALLLLPVGFAAPRHPALLLAGLLLLVPVPIVLRFMDATPWLQASVGSLYGWAMLLALVGVLWRPGAAVVVRTPS